ncbi:hypothetical protein PAXRUDRAFT_274301 [Paxillus rubicundulus Ve08.2h10]|uniref:Uncharacterized protein n=1 Tax=Paxillus rubicundulus Ve08.2h10 TaxID=930991 RepID=A0A0D0DF33_9AGAM|nr:hypothetical protein PAXRUDRAFT_274301 [Paxillus rubicundulus Ve08.2h10]
MSLSFYSWPRVRSLVSRPQSCPMDDQYWQFIERCWLEGAAFSRSYSVRSRGLSSLPPISPFLGSSIRLSTELTTSQPTSSGSLSSIVTHQRC